MHVGGKQTKSLIRNLFCDWAWMGVANTHATSKATGIGSMKIQGKVFKKEIDIISKEENFFYNFVISS